MQHVGYITVCISTFDIIFCVKNKKSRLQQRENFVVFLSRIIVKRYNKSSCIKFRQRKEIEKKHM